MTAGWGTALSVVVVAVVAGRAAGDTSATPGLAADRGNWTFGDCMMVTMAGQFVLNTDKTNANKTVTVDIPVTAAVSNHSSCNVTDSSNANATSQVLVLMWSDPDPDFPEEVLMRNFTVVFEANTTENIYGVSKMSGVYALRSYNFTDPSTNNTEIVKDLISFTTFNMNPMQFTVALNKSYMCMDLGSKSMEAELHKSNEHPLDPGEKLANATFTAKSVQLDAFRAVTVLPGVFQTPSDCSYRPNDVVPIIVGCALAGMVVMVLVAYMVGRSRSRARGYQSV